MMLVGAVGFTPYDIMHRLVCFEQRMEDQVFKSANELQLRTLQSMEHNNLAIIESNNALCVALKVAHRALPGVGAELKIHATFPFPSIPCAGHG